MEEFCEVANLVVNHLFVVQIMVGLKVNARIRHKQDAFDLNERQNLLYSELFLELGSLTDVF